MERKVNIDVYGRVSITDQEAFEALYTGKLRSLENVIVENGIEQYNQSRLLNADPIPELPKQENLADVSIEKFDESNQRRWFMPENYCPNLYEDLYGMCQTQEQIERVNQELKLFHKHGMIDLLYYLKYLVDTMRENNVVWGVGRGSSVASYVLYLIGIHKIDSIKYELDIHEFLKEK